MTALTYLCASPHSRVADGIGDAQEQRGSHAAPRTVVCMCCTPMLSIGFVSLAIGQHHGSMVWQQRGRMGVWCGGRQSVLFAG